MIPFLRQVAEHYVSSGEVKDKCFIFPNRRSMAFFNKWLGEAIRSKGGVPVLAPATLTINDFFARAASVDICPRVELLLKLYSCYKKVYPKAESIDEFIFWGDVLLGDFDDVDKYLVDPEQIFANISDYKAIQDTFSYLTEKQREAVEALAGHFRDRVAAKEGRNNVKENFLEIWNILLPLYREFNSLLDSEGRSYEGAMYRRLACSVQEKPVVDVLASSFPHSSGFVFVGLNALNECEKTVMKKMRDAGIAEFCWDYSGEMISNPLNKSSFFMSQNVKDFPQAFGIDPEGVVTPEFNVVSVSSSVGQVKTVPEILSRLDTSAGWERTAIVLPDEGLLMPMLSTLPENVDNVNVTMGYPMSASEFYSLMRDIVRLQMHLRQKNGEWLFYHKQVWDIFSSGIFKKLTDGDEKAAQMVKSVRGGLKYYIPQADLSGHPLFDMIFRPVVKDLASSSPQQIREIEKYQLEVISFAASRLAAMEGDLSLEVDFAKEYYTSIKRLSSLDLEVLPATYLKLLESLLSGVSVPFDGEPLRGLQIMGPLETRALDFDNVIILSMNEGVFPRRSVSSSFVPPELRKAFGLPTYEFQDAVWAYYFYRLVTRAGKVWMLYDSRSEGLKSGEESRYIKQLRYHFGLPLNMYVTSSEVLPADTEEDVIKKTPEDIETVRKHRWLSASALQNYIDCKAKFYFHTVKQLSKDDEVSESLDAGMIGTVYHDTMMALMTSEAEMLKMVSYDKVKDKEKDKVPPHTISIDYLKGWLKREDDIRRKVNSLICSQLKTDEVTGRDLVVSGVIVRYVIETIKTDIKILEDAGTDHFDVIGVEREVKAVIDGFRFFGYIDRLDAFGSTGLRVVDYKTGKDDPSVLCVDADNAASAAEKIFEGTHDERKKFKAGLQFYLYDRMVKTAPDIKAPKDPISNCMYSVPNLFTAIPGTYRLDGEFAKLMEEKLDSLLKDIADPDVDFTRTDDKNVCEWCDFKMICGR